MERGSTLGMLKKLVVKEVRRGPESRIELADRARGPALPPGRLRRAPRDHRYQCLYMLTKLYATEHTTFLLSFLMFVLYLFPRNLWEASCRTGVESCRAASRRAARDGVAPLQAAPHATCILRRREWEPRWSAG